MGEASFEWDEDKNLFNQRKHGVSFEFAQQAFDDPRRVIVRDLEHEKGEKRFFCLGAVGEISLPCVSVFGAKESASMVPPIGAREETL